jgi:hypothetical protein
MACAAGPNLRIRAFQPAEKDPVMHNSRTDTDAWTARTHSERATKLLSSSGGNALGQTSKDSGFLARQPRRGITEVEGTAGTKKSSPRLPSSGSYRASRNSSMRSCHPRVCGTQVQHSTSG